MNKSFLCKGVKVALAWTAVGCFKMATIYFLKCVLWDDIELIMTGPIGPLAISSSVFLGTSYLFKLSSLKKLSMNKIQLFLTFTLEFISVWPKQHITCDRAWQVQDGRRISMTWGLRAAWLGYQTFEAGPG